MWRTLLILAGLAALLFAPAHADPARAEEPTWETCRGALGAQGPVLRDCRPLGDALLDPQGREMWIRSHIAPTVDAEPKTQPKALYVVGVASSEIWLGGQRLGANGQPGSTAKTEIPGRYQIAFPLAPNAGGELVVRLSSFHGGVRFARPIGAIFVEAYPLPQRTLVLAVTFVAAGALLAAAFGLGVIHALRRTASSLILAAMAGVAGLQAVVENLRHLVPYAYPFHAWRVGVIWLLAGIFAVLLVAYVAGRFLPRARGPMILAALVVVAATSLAPGFDLKTSLALLAGVLLSGAAAVAGAWTRKRGAWPVLVYLALFLTLAIGFPEWLADLSYFLLAAGLVLPLLVVEVIRLGREDQGREAALVRAASRPDRLTVASPRGVDLVPIQAILAVVGADDYVELRLVGGRRLLHAARLDRLEGELPPNFHRVHRSVIANLAHVRRLERDGDRWRLHIDEEEPLPVSRARLAAVRDALDQPAVASRELA